MNQLFNALLDQASLSPSSLKDSINRKRIHHDSLPFNIKESMESVNGKFQAVRRLYLLVEGQLAKYSQVGWILAHDIEDCMLCEKPFSHRNKKFHCRACGIVVCASCSRKIITPNISLISCTECFQGQDTVKITPSFQLGLPVLISDLSKYGESVITYATSRLLIKTRTVDDDKNVFIEIFSSPLVPFNSSVNEIRTIYMISGPECKKVTKYGTIMLYSVVVHPSEIHEKTNNNELVRQAKAMISRVDFKTLQNTHEFKLKDSEIKYETNRKLKVSVPPLKAFNDLYQIPIPSKDFEYSEDFEKNIREQKIGKNKNSAHLKPLLSPKSKKSFSFNTRVEGIAFINNDFDETTKSK